VRRNLREVRWHGALPGLEEKPLGVKLEGDGIQVWKNDGGNRQGEHKGH
jgi:hypothetical protein